MNSKEAIGIILSNLKEDDIALFTTGFISRHAFSLGDRDANFYMIGSMGLVSAVGLGLALNTAKKIFIFDGDGSVLMDMGTMAMIANHKPKNLFHIVLDNEAYESTGSQSTISNKVDLSSVAKSLGYKYVSKIDKLEDLKKKCIEIMRKVGPYFLHIKVEKMGHIEAGRVSVDPDNLSMRIKNKIVRQ